MQNKIIKKLHRKKKIDECLQKYVNLEEQSGSGKASLGKEALKLIGLDIGIEALMALVAGRQSEPPKMGAPTATFQMPASTVTPSPPPEKNRKVRSFATFKNKPIYND